MKQFKNILIMGPREPALLSQAIARLNTNHSRLTLLTVAPNIEMPEVNSDSGKTIDLQKLLEEELQKELDDAASQISRSHDFRLQAIVTRGQPFLEVVRQVVREQHDLVMMMADGIESLRDQLFGTLSLHLIRKCPCAVWIVKPSRRKKLRKIFAAVDPDPENETRDQLNQKILERAKTIAAADQAELHVVHAWNTFGGEETRGRRWMSKTEIRLYVEQVADQHRRRLDQLLEAETDGSAIVHMLQGQPGKVIPEVTSREECDLLVMGTVCRTGIPGYFIGNTAEMILGQVDCSVLTVKPDGFETPVQIDWSRNRADRVLFGPPSRSFLFVEVG